MPKPIHETSAETTSGVLVEADNTTDTGRYLLQIISPGWGSSGYYSPDVLAEAATNKIIPAGTHMYADHPTAAEKAARPERSIRDLMAITTADATVGEAGALVAPIQVLPAYREFVAEAKGHIGASILGDATDISMGEAEGRRGRIIEGLSSVSSVDFVTRAGRGGKVLQLLESAREAAAPVLEGSNIGQHFESRIHQDFTNRADDMAAAGYLTREERITLSGAIGDALKAFNDRLSADGSHLYDRRPYTDPATVPATAATTAAEAGLSEAATSQVQAALDAAVSASYAGEKSYAWIRDFDPAAKTVWFTHSTPDEPDELLQSAYSLDSDGVAVLTGTATAVRAVTTYVPATRPDGTTTKESEEDTMPKIEIEEADHRTLTEAAGRVATLESERDTATGRAEVAEAQVATYERRDAARVVVATRVAEAGVGFTPLEEAGLLAALPLKEGALDVETFTTTVDSHLAEKKKAGGAGRVIGHGGTTQLKATDVSEALSDIDGYLGISKEA